MASSTTLSAYLEAAWQAVSTAEGWPTPPVIIPSQPLRIRMRRAQHDGFATKADLELVAGPPGCPAIQVQCDDSIALDHLEYLKNDGWHDIAFSHDT